MTKTREDLLNSLMNHGIHVPDTYECAIGVNVRSLRDRYSKKGLNIATSHVGASFVHKKAEPSA